MKIKTLLSILIICSGVYVSAQQKDFAFAITGDGNKDFTWMNIRQVDLTTGKIVKTIFERSKSSYTLTDINSKKTVDQTSMVNENIFSSRNYPTSTFVAAAAYDKRSNKLFFTPMRMGELRWLDMNVKNETPQFYTMSSSQFQTGDVHDEANHITRMVIAADGYGYAITNDGNHLFRFTTGKTPVITDLGNLVDADVSKGVSIHNKCTSWGGDMLADAFGKLYVISANRNVFEIDINTRITTFKGPITGLPQLYTTNGAAVSADGEVVVTSANFFEGYYKFKITDLAATKLMDSDAKYNASDLANGTLLLQKEADAANRFNVKSPVVRTSTFIAGEARVFPNPVTTSTFNVSFAEKQEGTYSIVLSDVAGRSLQSNSVNILKGGYTQQVNIINRPAKGVYMVKVLNALNQVILTEKIILE
jgi:hypothetical protein